ncbi:MAG: hypothetical protein M1832_000052 [Thelocarpon impressellum]|nr:MAG: hypothetical protein M1832_000052 [Thelocarpon impressellum]
MERLDKGADIVLVASEPLTFEREHWVTLPTNSILTIHKQTVTMHPIVDKYHNASPLYTRSLGYAVFKGLVSTGPGAAIASAAAAVAAGEPHPNGAAPQAAAVNGVNGGHAQLELEEAQQRIAELDVSVM